MSATQTDRSYFNSLTSKIGYGTSDKTSVLDCTQCATKMLKTAVLVSMFLGVFKVAVGIFSQSIGVTVDGLQSFGCAIVGLFVFMAVKVGKRPKNAKHPYGYGKIEFLVSVASYAGLFGLGMVMLLASSLLLIEGRQSGPDFMGLPVSIVSILVNYLIFKALSCAAKQTGSAGIAANAKQNGADMLSSFAVALGVGLAQLGPNFYFFDALAALVVSLLIMKDAALCWLSDIQVLIDRQIAPSKLSQIKNAVKGLPGIVAVKTIKARKIGTGIWVDMSMSVSSKATVSDAEQISKEAKNSVLRKLNWVEGVDVFLSSAS